jgi:acyl-CoA dehydrogenase
MTTPGEARERLSEQAYTTLEPGNPAGLLQEALELSIELAPLERRLRQAHKEGLIRSDNLGGQIDEAEKAEVISKDEAASLRDYHRKVSDLLAVDDFDATELARESAAAPDKPRVAAASKRSGAARKKSAPRKKSESSKKARPA